MFNFFNSLIDNDNENHNQNDNENYDKKIINPNKYQMYKFEFESQVNKFIVRINDSEKKVLGFICKLVDSNFEPVRFIKDLSLLSIAREVHGDVFTYNLDETIDFDYTYYNSHNISKYNLDEVDNLWSYFFITPTTNSIKLEFELEFLSNYNQDQTQEFYLFVNMFYIEKDQTIGIYPDYKKIIYNCINLDYQNGLSENNPGNICWMYLLGNKSFIQTIEQKEKSSEFLDFCKQK